MKKSSFFGVIRDGIGGHKVLSGIIAIALVGGGIGMYRSISAGNVLPQYVLAAARLGTLEQTVTGSGQVSASNQTDIQSQGSGTIESIDVSVGQAVRAGELIATLDVKNAAIALDNAKLSLAKLTQPAKATDISNATNNLVKSYSDSFNAVSAAYLDLPSIVSGLKDMLYGPNGFLSSQNMSFILPAALAYRDAAGTAYDAAVNEYAASLGEFKSLSRSSATSSLDQLFEHTNSTVKDVAGAIAKVQNAITTITIAQPDYNRTQAAAAAASVNGWAGQANGDLAAIGSAQNAVSSSRNSLTTLVEGADPLDIESARLGLAQAEQTYENYFIRAPYDGIIGRIPVNVYGQAAGSTVIATIIGQQKIATISLNEVDAAKVKTGLPVTITFDAIEGLSATGTVAQVDQVGTVAQGVVSYGIKILINTADDRIKPGMSVNTSIITSEQENALLVPSSAVKTEGQLSYVQVFDDPFGSSTPNGNNGKTNGNANGSNGYRRFASTTRQFSGDGAASGTPRVRGNGSANGDLTISSASLPRQVAVTAGDSDDTNTVIISGLDRGQFVVTRTITAGTAKTAAPSIFSTLGARAPAGGGRAPAGGGGRGGGAFGG
ncbi:MAG: HlyD family secretion protein [Candidatus Parcubacteria bacterium]|jgi:multidrug efflux pump subunit AcrA (membrane-fusion protein)|nr:HlyD family secretion protein [Candidatus Parcubacteria bacterium]